MDEGERKRRKRSEVGLRGREEKGEKRGEQ